MLAFILNFLNEIGATKSYEVCGDIRHLSFLVFGTNDCLVVANHCGVCVLNWEGTLGP